MSNTLHYHTGDIRDGADQVVRLVFAEGPFRFSIDQRVSGNTTGLSVIDSAVMFAYDHLPENSCDGVHMLMKDDSGNTLMVSDEDCEGDSWLSEFLISAEIISVTPKP